MKSPGFIIKNETIWPLQISLNQVSPLYFEVLKPGESFVRETGAVWFTIKASIFLDEKNRITTWDAVWPIAGIAGSVLIAVVTAGAAAYVAGPAVVVSAGAAGISGVTGLSSAAALATATAASALVGAGLPAGASLVIAGAVVGSIGTTLSTTATAAMKDIFSKGNASASKAGCYAGPPWPFQKDRPAYRIIGGPTYKTLSPNQVELSGQPLQIVSA